MRSRRITRQMTSFCLAHARLSISGKRHTQVLAGAHQANPTGGARLPRRRETDVGMGGRQVHAV